MPQKQFSISEAIHFGFDLAKKNWLFFLGLFLVTGIIQGIFSTLGADRKDDPTLIQNLISLVGAAVGMVISMGTIKITLSIIDGGKGDYHELFSQFPRFLNYFIASILYGLLVTVGFILLVIPGIYWAVKYGYYSYFIIDKGMSPIEAMKASAALTEGNKLHLIGLGLVLIGVNILGLLAFVVGLVISIPTTMLAGAYVYRKLEQQTEGIIPQTQSTLPSLEK